MRLPLQNPFERYIQGMMVCMCLILNSAGGLLGQSLSEVEINQKYERIKLELLCQSLEFLLKRYENSSSPIEQKLSCLNLESIAQSIPPDFQTAEKFFKLLASKKYESFGKNKLQVRLNKLIDDIQTELSKLYQDPTWKNDLQVLMLSLKEIKNTQLNPQISLKEETAEILPENEQIPINQTTTNPKTDNSMPIVYFILLVLIGCIGFLVWQNQKLKAQIEELDENYMERYSRLDNRMDTMTSIKDFQSLLLKFNFLNEQLNTLIHEVVILKNRNENKMTAEELYAKRTEHLENYTYNPTIQIYYARLDPIHANFQFQEFKTEPDKEHLYKIEINLENPKQALFSVVQRSEYHQLALLQAGKMLLPACQYINEPYNDSRIITIEPGILEKKENDWVIHRKAKVAFE